MPQGQRKTLAESVSANVLRSIKQQLALSRSGQSGVPFQSE